MRNPGSFLGIALILLGVVLFTARLFNLDTWAIFWPLALMAGGLWIILRPNFAPDGTNVRFRFIGEIDRYGDWQVNDEETSFFVGDADLDLTSADIPEGETHLRYMGFVTNVKLRLPDDVGLQVRSGSFVTDASLFGIDFDRVFSPLEYTSENYRDASRKIDLEVNSFVTELAARHV
ncbi:MAG: hypothetical protein DWQ07_23005 [Chloroflexi bacterium]|nr:MAG: hypothetical protein DWQ07_23005 [Chloroflexota bacterium]MBL1194018.1 hypothetical protein [Chloroflexota bacterium]NOH11312.1 cell wall-active antibiotics response protein [Chloroflexota bacterium]